LRKLLFSLLGIVVIFVIFLIIQNYRNTINFDSKKFLEVEKNYSYQIKRDTYGVPHVHGIRDKDAAFGFAVAQAQDDLEHIEMMIKMSRGTLSDFNFSFDSISALYALLTGNGDIMENIDAIEGVELDFLIKFFDTKNKVEKKITEIPKETLDYITGYSDGLNYYAAINPTLVDQSLYPTTAKDLLVGMTFQLPLFYGIDHTINEIINLMSDDDQVIAINKNDLSNNPIVASIKSHFKPSGSNAFAVSKRRSKDNETMLIINSHQPLTGPVAWYEIHLKSDEGLNIMGGTFPGSPFVHKGFNEHLGWGATVNQPDLSDIYKLTINSKNNDQYLLDGEWTDFIKRDQVFRVKLFGPLYINYPITMYHSEHGPVLKDSEKAYAIRFVGMDTINHSTAWFKMNKAKNFDEWVGALKMQEIASFNLVYADREDNIYFVHNMKAPKRNSDYDWTKVLPGDDSNLIWTEYHNFTEIPQILNPDSGYLFSTNQNPFFVTSKADNLLIDNFDSTMGFQTRTTNRAYRSFELFEGNESISFKELDNYKHDNKYSYNSRQYRFLKKILDYDFKGDQKLIDAQDFLSDWDLGTDSNNQHAAFGVCILSPEWLAEITRELEPDAIQIFKDCVDEFEINFGSLSISWKEVSFLERGNNLVHIQGGPDVLRAIYSPRTEDGILKAVAGDGLYIYVKWNNEQELISKSIHQFGSATIDRTSDHYDDQIHLFAREELKNTFFNEIQFP